MGKLVSLSRHCSAKPDESNDGDSNRGTGHEPAGASNNEGPRVERQRPEAHEAAMARRQRLEQLCRGASAHAKAIGDTLRAPDCAKKRLGGKEARNRLRRSVELPMWE